MVVHRRTVAVILVAGLMGIAAAPQAAAAKTKPDWILAKATTQRVSRITGAFAVYGRSTGTGPLVLGVGLSAQGGPDPFSRVSVMTVPAGSTGVGFTAGPIARYVTIDEEAGASPSFREDSLWIDHKARVVAVLVFVVNGVIDEVTWEPHATRKVTSTVRSGTGSSALSIGGDSFGAAASAVALAAGVSTFSRQIGSGIAGAIDWSCRVCAGTWAPPNGQARPWTLQTNEAFMACWCSLSTGTEIQFAGPAGSWAWTWSGVRAHPLGVLYGSHVATRRPALAAYAPIGNDWTLFKECRYSNGCVTSWVNTELDRVSTARSGR